MCRHDWILVRPLFPACRQPPSGCGHASQGGRERGYSMVSACEDTDPIVRDLPSGPHLNLTISQRPLLQTPSHWGLRIQRTNLGRPQTFSPRQSPNRTAGYSGYADSRLENIALPSFKNRFLKHNQADPSNIHSLVYIDYTLTKLTKF